MSFKHLILQSGKRRMQDDCVFLALLLSKISLPAYPYVNILLLKAKCAEKYISCKLIHSLQYWVGSSPLL